MIEKLIIKIKPPIKGSLLCGFLIFHLDDHKYLIIEKFFLDLVKLSDSILIKKK